MRGKEGVHLAAEQRARALIDAQLRVAGWAVQDRAGMNLFAGPGVAVREVVMAPGHGRVDYLLYVKRRVVGVIEAKPEGTALSGVERQSAMYATGLPQTHAQRAVVVAGRLPFVFEASGTETHLTNRFDPDPRARRIFAFPQPSTLAHGHRQDLHRRHRGAPAAAARRLRPGAVPGPQQPRRPYPRRAQHLPHPRRAPSHRDLCRGQALLRRDARQLRRTDLDRAEEMTFA